MLIGILSDTHNNVETAIQAAEYFKSRGISEIIHCGDISSPNILDFFSGFKAHFVFGNIDGNREELNKKAAAIGMDEIGTTCDLEIAGYRILVFHGDNVPLFREAVDSEKYDFIIKGHTHCFENYTRKRSRVINPGSLCKGEENSVAVLDTDSGDVEMVPFNF
jgi:uncharacterized protein